MKFEEQLTSCAHLVQNKQMSGRTLTDERRESSNATGDGDGSSRRLSIHWFSQLWDRLERVGSVLIRRKTCLRCDGESIMLEVCGFLPVSTSSPDQGPHADCAIAASTSALPLLGCTIPIISASIAFDESWLRFES
jgi:hypothetical protein